MDDGTTSHAVTLSADLRRALDVHHLATLEQEEGVEALRRKALRVDGDFFSRGLDIRRLREDLDLAMSQASLGKVAREEREEAVVARDKAFAHAVQLGGELRDAQTRLAAAYASLALEQDEG